LEYSLLDIGRASNILSQSYYNYTGLLKIIVGVLTTCHTQYT